MVSPIPLSAFSWLMHTTFFYFISLQWEEIVFPKSLVPLVDLLVDLNSQEQLTDEELLVRNFLRLRLSDAEMKLHSDSFFGWSLGRGEATKLFERVLNHAQQRFDKEALWSRAVAVMNELEKEREREISSSSEREKPASCEQELIRQTQSITAALAYAADFHHFSFCIRDSREFALSRDLVGLGLSAFVVGLGRECRNKGMKRPTILDDLSLVRGRLLGMSKVVDLFDEICARRLDEPSDRKFREYVDFRARQLIKQIG